MNLDRHTALLKAMGRIEGYKNDLQRLDSELGHAPLWLPGRGLEKQCVEALRMIADIAERFERKLVVTLVGPSGSGKSTLLNALAGVDDLSKIGHQRPTTGHLVIFSGGQVDQTDTGQLAEALDSEIIETRAKPAADRLEHVLLIDTPDTDSRAFKKHIPIVERAIEKSDMLICVFDAENPKRRDHVDFLAPSIQKFSGESLVCVLNKCDRLDEPELKNQIVPDFLEHIRMGWQMPADHVFCISARRNLQNPDWDDTAGPKHDFDEFKDLKQLVDITINRAGFIVDRRLENAKRLRDFVFEEAGHEVLKHKIVLADAAGRITAAEKKALGSAVSGMQETATRQFFGLNVVVYQKLAQRWLGPMGWMIAIWARLLIFSSGIMAVFRFGRPLRQVIGTFSALRHSKDAKSGVEDPEKDRRISAAFRNYRLVVLEHWPEIAKSMVQGGFDSSIRKVEDALSGTDGFKDRLASIWADALDAEIERVTGKLSGLLLQIVFNIPAIAILGYCGWLTLHTFFSGSYLSGDFFVHAFWAIGIILFLSFFILQLGIRAAAGAARITGKAFEKLKGQPELLREFDHNPLKSQLETVLGLAALAETNRK
ncbi:MAG: 50S ribosome-binding GTPase [Desulfobacterales bacterium]|jgi:energy-coupling factor transporter ATP-binding protein EcfA2